MRNKPALVTATLALTLLFSACGSNTAEVTEPPATTSTPAEPTETAVVTAEPTAAESPTETATETEEAPTSGASGDATITNMALCGDDTYDADADVCPEPDSGFTTSDLHCSGEAKIEEGGVLSVNFYYEGTDVYTITTDVPEDAAGSTLPVFAFFGVGKLDLPGGDWACDMTLGDGKVASVETAVDGPTEAYSQAMSCDSKDVYSDGDTSACLEDDSELSSVAEGTCSAVLTGAKDATIKIVADVVTGGQSEKVFLGEFESPGGVVVASGTISADPELPKGDYTCRMLLDDKEVGSHGFSVS